MTGQLTAQSCVHELVTLVAGLHSMLAGCGTSMSFQWRAQVLLVQPSMLLGFSLTPQGVVFSTQVLADCPV